MLNQKSRVMLVDDHPMMRQGLANLLGAEFDMEVCCEAEGAAQALSEFNESKPDLVIVDLGLKEGSGLELIKTLRKNQRGFKILVLSHYDDILYAERALSAGAQGYLNKQEPPSEVLAAIRKVLSGETYLSQTMEDRLAVREPGSRTGNGVESLTDREMQVFELIGQGLSNKEIAEKLYISIKTVETHRDHIRAKFSLDSGRELNRRAVQWAVENS